MAKVKSFLGDTKNAVLAIGGLAAAVIAVAGVVHLFGPGPTPPGIRADIEDVTLETNIGLKEFEDREQTADVGAPGGRVPAPAGYRFAAYTAAAGSAEPATGAPDTGTAPSTSTPGTTPENTTPTPTTTTPHSETHKRKSERATKKQPTRESESDNSGAQTSTHVYKRTKVTGSTTPESTATEDSSGPSGAPFVKPPPPETPFKSEGNAKILIGTGASTSKVEGVLAEAATATGSSPDTEEAAPAARIALPQHCGSSCAAGPTVDQIIADNRSPAQAAKKVAAVFRHSRARYYDHELHPLGADVEYTLKLTGFVHNNAILEWTLWSQSGNPLPHSWWQKVIVKQVKPSRYEETISDTFWAPLPPRPGNYTFHLAVYDEQGNRRGRVRTPVFH